MKTYTLYAASIIAALMAIGCARTDVIARDLLVLRATWHTPAVQAGVVDEATEAVAAIDAAILTGDPVRVKWALLQLEQPYLAIRAEITDPTPEQEAFDRRVQSLWDNLHDDSIDWVGAGVVVVRLLARAVA